MAETGVLNEDKWIRPWDSEVQDNLYEKDERFISIIIKGLLAYLEKHIILNSKHIHHFIFNTGSSIMYIEKNGYDFSWCETSGEDWMYEKLPRCMVELNDISVDTNELTSPYVTGVYERISSIDNKVKQYCAQIRRVPVELSITCKYVLGTFNESIILLQELIDKLLFQKYFNVIYLGQKIQCSIEFPTQNKIEINKIDMASPEPNQKNINLDLKICTNYPIVNDKTETSTELSLFKFDLGVDIERNNTTIDKTNKTIE
jgi:hypothetical protein